MTAPNYKAIAEIQERLDYRVTLWSSGETWDGQPAIGIDLPAELYRKIDDNNAAFIEAALLRCYCRLLSILRGDDQ